MQAQEGVQPVANAGVVAVFPRFRLRCVLAEELAEQQPARSVAKPVGFDNFRRI